MEISVEATLIVKPIRNTADYSPFGVQLDGRTIQGDFYRYGFQNQEKDDEIKGAGNSVNYTYRMHDPRVGRFFVVDPMSGDFPHNSTYAFCENSTIAYIELEGLEKYYAGNGAFIGQVGTDNSIRIIRQEDLAEGTKFVKWAIHQIKIAGPYVEQCTKAAKHNSTWIGTNLHNSLDDKSLAEAIIKGVSSSVFRNLIYNKPKEARVGTNGDPEGTYTRTDGSINIHENSIDSQILGLTWELTNNENVDRLNQHRSNLSLNKEQWIKGICLIEAEAAFNQMIVATDLGIQNVYLNQYGDDFNKVRSGIMQKQQLLQKISDDNYLTGEIMKNGSLITVQDEYGGQYDEAKEAQEANR